ncbi:flagellin [Jannaschia sp. W003]|uniref:flagellin n=1 Tax=Jannaschia sp. W003 TaxID=2867012 RepID=UPI0021A71152|nr:flagellin [Jannaschia sp. W003]UWQ21842.1 flagellin [Jannaschia sp. W003]
MSSILTNNSAMVALQTLQNINKDLGNTQAEISTGKSIGSARDNSAVWAISKQMESDVNGFKAIQESLSLGQSTVAVARNASETVTDLLTDIKGKIVAAQESNVDRDKIQTDITALTDQIKSVVGAAQFNGLNLVDGSSTTAVDVLSSLNRDSSGNVSAAQISVDRQNLSVTGTVTTQVYDGTGADTGTTIVSAEKGGTPVASGTATATDGTDAFIDINVGSVGEGFGYQLSLDDTGFANSVGTRTFEYVATGTDSAEDVANELYDQVSAFLSATDETNYTVSKVDGDTLRLTRANAGNELGVTIEADVDGNTVGSSSGGLAALGSIDVTTDAGATSALTAIEGLIDKAIDASASFGSAQGRIDTQSDFVSALTDSLTSGIGALVDADMEEASARLQALQVQQQLATQSLSIANQAPQSILALFR